MLTARQRQGRYDRGVRRASGNHDVCTRAERGLNLFDTGQRNDVAHGAKCRNGDWWRWAQWCDAALGQSLGYAICGLAGIEPRHLGALTEFGGELLCDSEHPVDGGVGPASARSSDNE